MQEILEDELEHGALLSLREGVLEILLGEASDLWRGVEERAKPKREYLFQMWAQLALSFPNERGKSLVCRLAHLLVSLVHKDTTHVVEEECQQVTQLLGALLNILIKVLLQLLEGFNLGYGVSLLELLEDLENVGVQAHHACLA